MNQLEQLVRELKPTHTIDYGFILVGIVCGILAFTQTQPVLYIVAGFGVIVGGLLFMAIHKRQSDFNQIIEKQYSDPDACLIIINRHISELKRAIEIDQKKADRGGKDAADSRDDVVRKTIKLDKYMLLQKLFERENIE